MGICEHSRYTGNRESYLRGYGMEIAHRLNACRTDHPSISFTAKAWDLPDSTIRQILRHPGGTTPSLRTLYKLSEKTNRSPHWLMTGEGPESLDAFKAALKSA